jgi:uracil phosphoribosyltransferase
VLDFQCILVLNYFDAAQNGFISASRPSNNDDYFEFLLNTAIADFNGKYLLLVDPMLATDNRSGGL